jgi:dihydrofolate reductase
MSISIISAIGRNNEIGKKNALLWDMPADLKHFKEKTSGHTIIMGQKTFESIGRPLPNRRNIVLTLNKNLRIDGVETFYSIEELEKEFLNIDEEVFIIGGGQIYKLFIEKADKLYLTEVEADFKDADTFFPTFDKNKWQKVSEEKHEPDEKNKYSYTFTEYLKKIINI